jgi:hypothetical protein
MNAALNRFDAEHLATVSSARRAGHLAIISDLQDWLAPMPLDAPQADAIARFLADRARAGYSPGTVRKWRAMILAFYAWAWRERHISGDTLLELRAIRAPTGSGARAQPHPYRPGELRELRRGLDRRWPKLPPDEAARWVARWQDGRSPYSRIRSHAIRLEQEQEPVSDLLRACGLMVEADTHPNAWTRLQRGHRVPGPG